MLQLSKLERESDLWGKIEVELKERLQRLRVQNDDTCLDADETAVLRGCINEVKRILNFGAEPKGLVETNE